MSERTSVPDELRAAIAAEMREVRPLPSEPRRLLWVALCAAAIVPAVLLLAGLRSNAGALGPILLWGATAAQVVAGLAIVGLALREAIPGEGASGGTKATALLVGGGLQVIASLGSSLRLGGLPTAPFWHGETCAAFEVGIAVPTLAVTLLLVARAYAVRPRWAGVLGGAGVGLIADGIWRLVCTHSDLAHLFVWHTGAVVLVALIGLAAGALTASQRARRVPHRAES